MDIRQLRRHNVFQLLGQLGITKAEFARRINKSSQHVQVFLRKKNPGNIGHSVAREIEKAFDLPETWLDKDHSETDKFTEPDSAIDSYRQASQIAESFVQIQEKWFNARKHAIRKVEDEFAVRLKNNDLQIMDVLNNSEFKVASPANGLLTVALFTPIPGFSRWYCPRIEKAIPDILAVTLLTETEIEFAVIPKELIKKLIKERPSIYINIQNRTANQETLESLVNCFELI